MIPHNEGSSRHALADFVNSVCQTRGPKKPMGQAAPAIDRPHYYLLRKFKGDVDLLIILNTKRCHYQCDFCNLPAKSSRTFIDSEHILAQMQYVFDEVADAISVVDRVSLSNEGSVLDEATLPRSALTEFIEACTQLPACRRIVLETRLEFVTESRLRDIETLANGRVIDILTGLETINDRIRNEVLGKRQDLTSFTQGLDAIAQLEHPALTSYVLVKPDFAQTDDDAMAEATRTILYLAEQCAARSIALGVRINPMYIAEGTQWANTAQTQGYQPPRLTDVLELAEWCEAQGIPAYIGLSSEGLADETTSYRAREDFSKAHLKRAIRLNTSGA
jgi:radical SAM enzyme (TIGR01210 family)